MQEETTSKISILNPEDEECEQHFLSICTRDTTGRYIVRLPLKTNPSILGDSKSKALSCLTKLSRRLTSDPVYRQLYVDFIKEYQSLGHMVPAVTAESHISPVYYLPHHRVLREQNRTTKL